MPKRKICFYFFIVMSNLVFAQTNIYKFSSKITFTKPSEVWKLSQDDAATDGGKGMLVYKHTAIKDSKGRSIEPVIAIMYENIPDPTDVTAYSVGVLGKKPFTVNHKLLGGFPDYSSDHHSVVYSGDYTRGGVKHKVLLGYIAYKHVGIEVVCDATDEIFAKVKADMSAFIKSVSVKD